MQQALVIAALYAAATVQGATGVPQPDALPTEREMNAFVQTVIHMTGLHNDVRVVIDPETKSCAYAMTFRGKQYIGVDPSCVGQLSEGGVYRWSAVGVLTHEIGHLLGGHTTNQTHSQAEEREADEWAGWAMYRLGATLAQAQTFYQTTSPKGSKSHPPRATRLASVAQGFENARAGTTPIEEMPVGETIWARFLTTRLPWAGK